MENAIQEMEKRLEKPYAGVTAIDKNGNFGIAATKNVTEMPWVFKRNNSLTQGMHPRNLMNEFTLQNE